jgi:hypothetical protein
MKIGTKSVLFGAHCFFIHPWFVAFAWYKLYGFPWDPRLWVCFFVHDLGYWGKPNMDGPEGERHVEFGADIMKPFGWDWYYMCQNHSRYWAKTCGQKPSRLCFADKLSLYYTPAWLYLPMVCATGEIKEYLKNAEKADSNHWKALNYIPEVEHRSVFLKRWYAQLQKYMHDWVYEHLDGRKDEWTDEKRHSA